MGRRPVLLEGEHYTITDYDGIPKPVQQPHPPILVGGGGPKLLRLAGREADIVGINPNLRAGEVSCRRGAGHGRGDDQAEDRVDPRGRRRPVRRPRAADPLLRRRHHRRRRGLAEAIAPGFGLEPDEALESGVALVGTVDEMLRPPRRSGARSGACSYVVLGDDHFEAFAPVVARLAGT